MLFPNVLREGLSLYEEHSALVNRSHLLDWSGTVFVQELPVLCRKYHGDCFVPDVQDATKHFIVACWFQSYWILVEVVVCDNLEGCGRFVVTG